MGLISAGRSFLRALLRAEQTNAEMQEEMRFHIEMEGARLVREKGMTGDEAARAAEVAFGGVDRYREAGRDARRVTWISGATLDFRLGFRMLVKYPWLTIVGGLSMAFAICIGVAAFEFLNQLVDPSLGLPGSDRIVGIRNWDLSSREPVPLTFDDVARWQRDTKSIAEISAFRTVQRNLTAPGAVAAPVQIAEVTAAGLRMTGVPPHRGRALVEEDEAPGAPAVAVIGYGVWRERFGADEAIVGRDIRLGNISYRVVGIMPRGFLFPVHHDMWTPLRAAMFADTSAPLYAFGRLADGRSMREAYAELRAAGQRLAAQTPSTHAHVQTEVLSYAQAITGIRGMESVALLSVNLFLVMLVILVCANVALLIFARAATRAGEITVRNALGASRGRIVMQLFAEALVLGGVAAAIGLAAAGSALGWWLDVAMKEAGGRLPFWFNSGISSQAVLYTIVLTLLAATIAGVLPALKATRDLGSKLRQIAAGSGGMRFGGIWTAVIVAQVAVTVAFPASAFFIRRDVVRLQSLALGFPASEFLTMRVVLARGAPAEQVRELRRRLEAEPWVAGTTIADKLPGTYHPQHRIEVDGITVTPIDPTRGHQAGPAVVGADFFDVIGTKQLKGRLFAASDTTSSARVVVVNEPFVREIMGGRNPVGLRLRYFRPVAASGAQSGNERSEWFRVVGVVPDLGMISGGRSAAGLYHPAGGVVTPLELAVHVRGNPSSFVTRIRTIAADVDPEIQLHDMMPLNERGSSMWTEFDFLFRILVVVSAVAMVLSLAGIYAVMAFTVARRTREIGIRVALGAGVARVLASTFRGPLAQVGAGIAAGAVMVGLLAFAAGGGAISLKQVEFVLAYAVLICAVCLLACIVPTLRVLRIEPTTALRQDG